MSVISADEPYITLPRTSQGSALQRISSCLSCPPLLILRLLRVVMSFIRPSSEDKLSRQSAASSFVIRSHSIVISFVFDCHGTQPPPSSVLRPLSPQSTCTPSPVFPASLHHVLLIILWFLARSDELEASPQFIFLSLDLSLPPLLSVAAPLRSSILIPSTPPSVHPSHVKSLSREDVPRVSAHPSASL